MRRVLIVAHDAGAANHLVLLDKDERNNYLFHLAGPAKQIFGNTKSIEGGFHDVIATVDLVITGTGWETNFEYDAIKLAKRNNKRVISILDHWTNYRERFVRNNEEILSDEIWVFDKHALKLAKSQFPSTPIILQENRYLNKQVHEINKKETYLDKEFHLFLMEPLGVCCQFVNVLEFEAFDYFLKKFTWLGLYQKKIIVKPHPSDKMGKYNFFIAKYPNFHIEIADSSCTLAELIANADRVVGCQTYAMVVALCAGKNVISVMPSSMGPCVLPYKDITLLSFSHSKGI
jgi:hypothetical protein